MARPSTVAARPGELDGCWASWAEEDVDNVIRTEMDSGAIKSRRRFTGRQRSASVSVRLTKDKYTPFITWYRVNCRAGSIPTQVMTPYGVEEYWCFASPPTISWIEPNVFEVNAELYQLSSWGP